MSEKRNLRARLALVLTPAVMGLLLVAAFELVRLSAFLADPSLYFDKWIYIDTLLFAGLYVFFLINSGLTRLILRLWRKRSFSAGLIVAACQALVVAAAAYFGAQMGFVADIFLVAFVVGHEALFAVAAGGATPAS